jgi:hypothetical protein
MNWLDRQSFLGINSDQVLRDAVIGLAGLGGGGSHVVQQLAHVGVGNFVVLDDDSIDDTNLNRLIGGRHGDLPNESRPGTDKVEIARRLIVGINPAAKVFARSALWQVEADRLKGCDLIVGGLDSVRAKSELEGFSRRFLIPYLDMGMDVHALDDGYLIAGQVALSMPGCPCLRCMGIVRQEALDEEGRNYGAAGGKPQVVWPNGVLASTAVGLAVQILSPWLPNPISSTYLEYDGNSHTIKESTRFARIKNLPCPHYPGNETGDPSFDVRKVLDTPAPVENVATAAAPAPSWWRRLFGWLAI